MNPETVLTKALAAGAVAMFRPNVVKRHEGKRKIDREYLELKALIKEKYPQVNADMLDLGPGSAEAQGAMAEQLKEAGVTEDDEVTHQAQALLKAISEEDPSALWAAQPAEPPAHLK
jgi:hypothetical protein